jgi:hypothetical protein
MRDDKWLGEEGSSGRDPGAKETVLNGYLVSTLASDRFNPLRSMAFRVDSRFSVSP